MSSKAIIKNDIQIKGIRESASLLSQAMGVIAEHIEIGKPVDLLNSVATDFIRGHGAEPAFLNYQGFPNALCISINAVVVHGIPPKGRLICEGDILSIDCGVNKNQYYSDMAYSYLIGEVDEELKLLTQRTKEALVLGVENVKRGRYTGDVGYAIENYIKTFNYGIVRDLVGHGVGLSLHEKPEVPNYGQRGKGKKFKKGMTLAIEPMINMGSHEVVVQDDKWTVETKDKSPSAHFEHTVLVTDKEAELLTNYCFIEKAIAENENIS